jgi:hypothetical protein
MRLILATVPGLAEILVLTEPWLYLASNGQDWFRNEAEVVHYSCLT